MVLRLFEQDVQISAFMPGRHVGATLENHSAVRAAAGHDIRGVFFDVQEARISRVHGCTRATLGTSFFGQAKKKYLAGKGETITYKES